MNQNGEVLQVVGTRGRELGCWVKEHFLAFRFSTGNCFIRYTFGFRCLCSRRQPFRTVSLLVMLIIENRTKPTVFASRSRGPVVTVFPKAAFELCQLSGLKFILCPLPLSAAWQAPTFLCSVNGRTLGLLLTEPIHLSAVAHLEVTSEQLVRGYGSRHVTGKFFLGYEKHLFLTAYLMETLMRIY